MGVLLGSACLGASLVLALVFVTTRDLGLAVALAPGGASVMAALVALVTDGWPEGRSAGR